MQCRRQRRGQVTGEGEIGQEGAKVTLGVGERVDRMESCHETEGNS